MWDFHRIGRAPESAQREISRKVCCAVDIVAQWCESKILSTYAHGTWEERERRDYQRGHSCGLRTAGRRGGLRD